MNVVLLDLGERVMMVVVVKKGAGCQSEAAPRAVKQIGGLGMQIPLPHSTNTVPKPTSTPSNLHPAYRSHLAT